MNKKISLEFPNSRIIVFSSELLMIIEDDVIRMWSIKKGKFVKEYYVNFNIYSCSVVPNGSEFYLLYDENSTSYYYDSSTRKYYHFVYLDDNIKIIEGNDSSNEIEREYAPMIQYVGNDKVVISFPGKNIDICFLVDLKTSEIIRLPEGDYLNSKLISKNIFGSDNAVIDLKTGKELLKKKGYGYLQYMPFRTDKQIERIMKRIIKVLDKVHMISSNIKKVIAKFV